MGVPSKYIRMKINKTGTVFVLILFPIIISKAQENSFVKLDSVLVKRFDKLESEVSILNKIKFSGFLQTQWQKADTIGTVTTAGGNFDGFDNRFQIRRAHLKASYTHEFVQLNLQFYLRENDVLTKEANIVITDPWLKTFTLTSGIFKRPFGFEVEYSSSLRETPEHSRVVSLLCPDEFDLGSKLTIQPPKTSKWNFLKLEAGLFNGNAIASEYDKYKDFISRLNLYKSFYQETLTLSRGISYYNGGVALPLGSKTGALHPYIYKVNDTAASFVVDSTYTRGDKIKREYFGVDIQTSIKSAIGTTTLRGEYIFGKQPGTKEKSNTLKTAFTGDVYLRNFSGGYVYFVQRFFKSKHEFVFRYDWYDPNTEITKNEIGKDNSFSGSGDIKYTTYGLGWNYYFFPDFRISVFRDLIRNEESNNLKGANGLNNYAADLKDDLRTIRLNYRF